MPVIHAALRGRHVERDSWRLFDAIHRVTRARYVSDSSKILHRIWSLARARPGDVWLIVLTRDYRAVAHSMAKRGRALDRAAHYWVQTMRQADELAASLAGKRVIRMRYEDLCADPESTLRALCAFLGLEFTPSLLARGESHDIGGSPSKFDPARRTIFRDVSYLDQLSATDLRAMQAVAGKYAAQWGYA